MNIQEVFEKCHGKGKVVLVRDDEAGVYYIVMNTSYNMIDPDFVSQFNRALDEIEQNTKGPGIVVTIGSGPKVFSSGFNLKFW